MYITTQNMSSKCLVAEGAGTTKSELEEIASIMAGVSLQEEEKETPDTPEKKEEEKPKVASPPPETPPVVVMEKTPTELSKAVLSEADPYFKGSSDEEAGTYI